MEFRGVERMSVGTYLLDSDKVMGCEDELAGSEILRFGRGERLVAGGGIDVEEAAFRTEVFGGMTSEYRFFGRFGSEVE